LIRNRPPSRFIDFTSALNATLSDLSATKRSHASRIDSREPASKGMSPRAGIITGSAMTNLRA